jgi:hypothetical protein
MATDLHPAPGSGVTTLMSDIIGDLQNLVAQQLRLFRTEVSQDFRKTRKALTVLAVGLAVTTVGAIFLCLAAAHLLHWAANVPGEPERLPLWGCHGLVGLVLAGLGAGLTVVGRQKFDTFNPLPNQTAAGLKETLEWKTNPQ